MTNPHIARNLLRAASAQPVFFAEQAAKGREELSGVWLLDMLLVTESLEAAWSRSAPEAEPVLGYSRRPTAHNVRLTKESIEQLITQLTAGLKMLEEIEAVGQKDEVGG